MSRPIRGQYYLTTRVSLSSHSATSYWVMFQINSFPNESEYLPDNWQEEVNSHVTVVKLRIVSQLLFTLVKFINLI